VSTTPQRRFPRQVRGIYVRRAASTLANDFNPLNAGQQLGGQIESIQQVIGESRDDRNELAGLLFITTFKFTYRLIPEAGRVQATPEDLLVAEIEAEFAGEYADIPEGYVREEIEQFGARSVMAHLWPYWREFLHSQLNRMSLPTVSMPPLFMPAIQKNPAPTE
jgi:hypothetical protein